jgi:hypothetical protein
MNKVHLRSDKIIEVRVVGDQTIESINQMGKEAEVLLVQLRKEGTPCLVLDDVTEIGNVDPDGRKLVVDFAKRLDYDKAAMVGRGGLIRLGANLMLRATGKAGKAKYFDDRSKALAWLKT